MVVIVYLFTQIFIIGHKGTIFFPKQKFCFRVHFCFSCKNVASKSFYKSKIHPFPLMLMQRNEMWYTYTPLGIYLITQYPCRSVVNCSSEMVVKDARHLLCFVIPPPVFYRLSLPPLPCFAIHPSLAHKLHILARQADIFGINQFHRHLFHSKNICPLLFLTSR